MYQAPANTAAVTLTSISSTAYNTLETDIGTEITNSVDRGGRSAMTAALPMGGQKITGMADPVLSTDGATKGYVDTTTAAFFSTGDVKLTLKTVADSGWLLFDDGTFGSATSGSSNSNSANNLALFNLLFANLSDTAAPLLTSGGGATTRAAQTNAATAWAANCRMTLPKTLGRALGVAGSGSGLTARPLGSIVGAETVTLTLAHLPTNINSTGAVNVSTAGISAVVQNAALSSAFGTTGAGAPAAWTGGAVAAVASTAISGVNTFTSNNTSGQSHSIMPPEVFMNAMIKI